MMSVPGPATPPRTQSPVDKFASFTVGMLLFVPIDLLLLVTLSDRGSLFAGLAFLAVIAAVAWRTARTRQRWTGLGLAAGFALMTLLTGGVCTLFGGNVEYPVGGLLYVAISLVLLVVAVILQAVQRMRRPPPPEPRR